MTDHDERLASILESLLDSAAEGTRADRVAQAVAENPDLEREIRELAATAMTADDVAFFQFGDLSAALKVTINSGDKEPAASGNLSSTLGQGGIGAKIGEYELLEEIGRGGMGVVFRARQPALGRDVALKMIPNAEFAASDDLARLRLEALAAGQLSHPNVVPVYDVGDHGGHPWFCMKYIEGETLNDRLMNGPMDAQEAVRLLLPVADAIQTAHAEGILHRDLKPSNILIDHDGTPFVTDFGLAKRIQSTTDSQKHMNSGGDASITKNRGHPGNARLDVTGTGGWTNSNNWPCERHLQFGSHPVCDAHWTASFSGDDSFRNTGDGD